MTLKIGLTGGIASGKSTVSAMFAELGVPVIDADQIAREVVEPGQRAFEEIIEAFGPEVVDSSGRLSRRSLRAIVFDDPGARQRLEAILHPRIRKRMFETATATDAPYCILVIPLLVENGLENQVDRVLVVDVPESIQRQRLAARDRSDPEEVEAILASQASREQRLAVAHDVIDNAGDQAGLQPQVLRLHRTYLELAANRPGD